MKNKRNFMLYEDSNFCNRYIKYSIIGRCDVVIREFRSGRIVFANTDGVNSDILISGNSTNVEQAALSNNVKSMLVTDVSDPNVSLTIAPVLEHDVRSNKPELINSVKEISNEHQNIIDGLRTKVRDMEAQILSNAIVVDNSKEIAFDIPFSNFSVVTDTHVLVDEASREFDVYVTRTNRYVVADAELSHLKNKNDIDRIKRADELYINWQTSKDLEKLYVKSVYNAFDVLSPIGYSYIKEIEIAVMSNTVMSSTAIFQLNPSGKFVVAKSIYGLSHGLHDMHHFAPSLWKSYKLVIDYSSKLEKGQSKHITHLSCRDAAGVEVFSNKVDEANFVYSLEGNPDLSVKFDNETSFMSDSQSRCYKSLYEISGSCEFEFNVEGVTERIGVTLRDRNGVSFSDAFRSVAHIVEGMDVSPNDVALVEQLSGIFMLASKSNDMNQISDILRYVSTGLYHFFSSNINAISGAKLVSFKFDVDVCRNHDSSSLQRVYRSFVDTGLMVPLTPFQIKFYLDKPDWDSWYEYCLYSSLANLRVNPKLRTVMPSTIVSNKSNMARYSVKRHEYLNSATFESDSSLPYLSERTFRISYASFLHEMFVRTVLEGAMPDYMYPVSSGSWKGSLGSSVNVMPVNLHPVFCKFGLDSKDDNISEFVENVSLNNKEFKPPYFCKSKTRLTRVIPNIYNRYLPIADLERPVDEIIYDEPNDLF